MPAVANAGDQSKKYLPLVGRWGTGVSEPNPLLDGAQIRTLLSLVETRSFSRTAAALGVKQPSVSQQVKRVEAVIGRPLFRRRHTGVELTRDGEAVVVYARAVMALGEDLRCLLARNEGLVRISLGMSEDFSRTALPSVLGLFAQDHRNVELRVISGTSYEMLSAEIENGKLDIAVLRRNARFPNLPHLWTDDLVWVGRHDLKTPVVDPVPLCSPIDNPGRDVAIATLEAADRAWHMAFESNSLASIEAAIQARLGVGACPSGMRYYDIVHLDAESGLPPLPKVDFVMYEPADDAPATVRALSAIIRSAAQNQFRSVPPVTTGA